VRNSEYVVKVTAETQSSGTHSGPELAMLHFGRLCSPLAGVCFSGSAMKQSGCRGREWEKRGKG
jgi:hypothetical protein